MIKMTAVNTIALLCGGTSIALISFLIGYILDKSRNTPSSPKENRKVVIHQQEIYFIDTEITIEQVIQISNYITLNDKMCRKHQTININ